MKVLLEELTVPIDLAQACLNGLVAKADKEFLWGNEDGAQIYWDYASLLIAHFEAAVEDNLLDSVSSNGRTLGSEPGS